MENYIVLFILIPLLGFVLNSVIPKHNEIRLAQVSFLMMGTQFVSVLVFTIIWVFFGANELYKVELVMLNLPELKVFIDFKYDYITAVFLLVGAFIAFMITTYSRNYLHRESGFKRFYTTVLFFYLGYNIIVLSGNLTAIFIGWEVAGISSFLLIAYYRNRYIPVKNAIKIFSIYRLGDIALMFALWLSHHIWHDSITLQAFSDKTTVLHHIHEYQVYSILFVLCIFTAASIKSAQFPFSAWLPRAMEGPTPSSAIFYSSLAVHLGILVLLKTYNFWVEVPYMKALLITISSIGFLLSYITSRIQPSIKGQIAYSVISQTALMAIEIAMGWHILAVVHFASHALLRCYQLLISPSIVHYAIKMQFYSYKPIKRAQLPKFIRNISNSVYILSLQEWYLDTFVHKIVWGYFKDLGLFLHKIPVRVIKTSVIIVVTVVPVLVGLVKTNILQIRPEILIYTFLGLALIYALRIFTEREKVLYAWIKIAAMHFLILSAMYLNGMSLYYLSFYGGGVTLAFIVGHFSIEKIRKAEEFVSLKDFQGHCYEYPQNEFWFFVASLGLMGFPITSAFVGQELILNGARADQPILLGLLLLLFFLNGLSMVRMYARVFLGPHIKTYHESARKSS